MKNIILFFLLIATVTSCQHSNTDIVAARRWKAASKPLLGDWLTFSENKNGRLFISNDTIYKNGQPTALVISTEYNIDHYVLTIHSIDHKQTGTYIDKGRAE
jgi:hypothetical protein